MNKLLFSLKVILCLIVLFFITLLGIDYWITYQTSDAIYDSVEKLPHRSIALIPGTSKYIHHDLNPFYQHRIEMAYQAYSEKKVDKLLLSGDNAARNYNEPWTMRKDMVKRGIPEKDLTLDYAGFRTLDSVVRAKKIFALDTFTIITQRFQCERAIFIAEHKGIDVICLAVPGASGLSNVYIRFREVLARVKALLDLYILHIEPKYLGPKEPIFQKED